MYLSHHLLPWYIRWHILTRHEAETGVTGPRTRHADEESGHVKWHFEWCAKHPHVGSLFADHRYGWITQILDQNKLIF